MNINGTGNMTINATVQNTTSSGPLIVSSTTALAYAGRPFKFQVVTNRATAAARISATGLPAGLTLDPIKGLISGTTNAVGSFTVNLTVTDGSLTVPGFLQLTFTSDASYPVITNANKVFLPRNQFFSYTIATPGALDPSDPPSYTMLGTLPAGLQFNASNGTVSGACYVVFGTAAGFANGGPVTTNNVTESWVVPAGGKVRSVQVNVTYRTVQGTRTASLQTRIEC